MPKALARFLDLREGEGKLVLQAFSTLVLLVAGHTILETARDALFLASLPPSRLSVVYAMIAAIGLLVSVYNARFVRRFGRRNALIFTLVAASYGAVVLHLRRPTEGVVLALYVFSGLIGTVLVAQFWLFAGQLFTAAQGRRLFGPITAGGVLGAVAGAGVAASLLGTMPVGRLLLVSATLFIVAAVLLTTVRDDEQPQEAPFLIATEPASTETRAHLSVVREHPYLIRIALLVTLSTAAVLTTDYLFKATAARTVPRAELGMFFARYYAVLNALALVVQIGLSTRLVRRVGVVGAVGVMPFLLMGSGFFAMAAGAPLTAILVAKGVDGSLRHSLNRVATELLWMPVDTETRVAGKAVIDTVLGRVVQAAMAALLLGLSTLGWASAPVLAGIVGVLSLAWLVVAIGLQRPYLDLFRQALSRGNFETTAEGTELDVASVEALLEALSSRDERKVIGALDLLAGRGRDRLIPALVLYHESTAVLLRALEVFGATTRTDFLPLAERLLEHPAERVRVAALRVLARRGAAPAVALARDDASPAVRVVAAFYLAEAEGHRDPLADPRITEAIQLPGDAGIEARAALADAVGEAPDARAPAVLLALLEQEGATESIVAAMGKVKDAQFIPALVAQLGHRQAREAVRQALVAHGDAAFTALSRSLADPRTGARVRVHLPRTLSRFQTQATVDLLTEHLALQSDGHVRYKVLLGLTRLTEDPRLRVDREKIEAAMHRNLVEHLRLLAVREPILRGQSQDPTRVKEGGILVLGLLDDKLTQSLDRAFRLLQITHRTENIRRVQLALRSPDRRVRANAVEFLEALRASEVRTRRSEARALLRIVAEDLPDAERVARAQSSLPVAPRTYEDAIAVLLRDRDETLSALAAYHAVEVGLTGLVTQIRAMRRSRLTVAVDEVMGRSPAVLEPSHA